MNTSGRLTIYCILSIPAVRDTHHVCGVYVEFHDVTFHSGVFSRPAYMSPMQREQ